MWWWLSSVTLASPCVECHERVVEQWAASRHAVTATNPVFAAAWQPWPLRWCVGCHAPEVATEGDAREDIAWQSGVGCTTCHGEGPAVVSAREATAAAEAAHPVGVDPTLASEALCARCHEFSFQKHTPAWPLTLGEEPLQATVSEWQASASALSCVDCHMGRHGHRFPGGHDRAPDGSATRSFELTGSGTWWRLRYRLADREHLDQLPPDQAGYLVVEGPVPSPR